MMPGPTTEQLRETPYGHNTIPFATVWPFISSVAPLRSMSPPHPVSVQAGSLAHARAGSAKHVLKAPPQSRSTCRTPIWPSGTSCPQAVMSTAPAGQAMKGTRSIVHKSATFMNTFLQLSAPVDRRRSSQKRHAPPEPGARDHLPGREARGAPGLPQLGYTALALREMG